MRFEEIYGRWQAGRLMQEEAAEILGVDVRTIRRWMRRYEEEGLEGLVDQRIGMVSARRAPVDQVLKVQALYRQRYERFTAKHFHEKLREAHRIDRSYTWTKRVLQEAGLVVKAKRRGAHRKRRERRPLPGMMLHQDGSRYEWVAGYQWDLIVTMDDADNTIYSAFFVEEEGTMSSFLGVRSVIESQGLFASLYVDRGSHYFLTPKAGGKIDPHQRTQFHRAMDQLGIELIPAYSPQARGRSERLFKTLQDRLPKELALAGSSTMAAANRFLQRTYLAAHNRRFRIAPADHGSAFVPFIGQGLADILCVQHTRIVANDNTVRYNSLVLQIPQDTHRCHYVKATVHIHEYPDRTLAIFHGPRKLARYDSKGRLFRPKSQAAA
ncbi:MAG: ISNCY family transposase [Betaproteobacteria bacterium]